MKDFIQGIKNILYFGKAIWRFRGWDHHHTEVILLLCLQKLEEDIRTFPYGHGTKQRGYKQLRIAIGCLKRIISENDDNVSQYIERRYGKRDFDFKKVGDSEFSTLLTIYEKSYTPEEIEKIEKDISNLYRHSRYLEKQNYEILGNSLKFLPFWWT
jgi:hypothetical protein